MAGMGRQEKMDVMECKDQWDQKDSLEKMDLLVHLEPLEQRVPEKWSTPGGGKAHAEMEPN